MSFPSIGSDIRSDFSDFDYLSKIYDSDEEGSLVPETARGWESRVEKMKEKQVDEGAQVLEVNILEEEPMGLTSAKSITSLFEALENKKGEGVCGLLLDLVEFNEEALRAFFEKLIDSPWVVSLHLSDCFFPVQKLPGDLVDRVKEKLSSIDLRSMLEEDDHEFWEPLSKLLSNNFGLKDCGLSEMMISEKIAVELGEALKTCKNLESLKMYRLEFTEKSSTDLSQAIAKMPSLKSLSIEEVEGAQLEALVCAAKQAKVEDLSLLNCEIGEECFLAIFSSGGNLKTLSLLDAGFSLDNFGLALGHYLLEDGEKNPLTIKVDSHVVFAPDSLVQELLEKDKSITWIRVERPSFSSVSQSVRVDARGSAYWAQVEVDQKKQEVEARLCESERRSAGEFLNGFVSKAKSGKKDLEELYSFSSAVADVTAEVRRVGVLYFLEKMNLNLFDIPKDGNCLFASIAEILFKFYPEDAVEVVKFWLLKNKPKDSPEVENDSTPVEDAFKSLKEEAFSSARARLLRQAAVAYMRENSWMSAFLGDDEMALSGDLELDWQRYCDEMNEDTIWGGSIEAAALAGLLQREIFIYDPEYEVNIVMDDKEKLLPSDDLRYGDRRAVKAPLSVYRFVNHYDALMPKNQSSLGKRGLLEVPERDDESAKKAKTQE